MSKPSIIILLGPPGSGKGTQAKFLQKKFNLKYIGSGDILRERKRKKDFTGRKIAQVIDKGGRVPTPVIFKLWMDRMEFFKQKKDFNGFIIDGSPRTVLEAEMIDQALDWYEWNKNKKILLIDVSTKEIIWRLTKRRMCQKCGRIMPFVGKFRKMEECDKCGGKLTIREDDNAKGVRERLKWFQADVRPAINYYRKKKELIRINGEQSIEDVFKEILEKIK